MELNSLRTLPHVAVSAAGPLAEANLRSSSPLANEAWSLSPAALNESSGFKCKGPRRHPQTLYRVGLFLFLCVSFPQEWGFKVRLSLPQPLQKRPDPVYQTGGFLLVDSETEFMDCQLVSRCSGGKD